MTNQQHPITPSPELVQQWLGTYFGTTVTGEVSGVELALATLAAQWGADQELEACCEWLRTKSKTALWQTEALRAARRPKPPSLKEQALEQLDGIATAFRITHWGDLVCDKILAALEAMPND